MRNIIKKFSALVMSITILSAGTAFTTTSSSGTTTLVATAASISRSSNHAHGQYTYTQYETYSRDEYCNLASRHPSIITYTYTYEVKYCRACGGVVSSRLVSTDTKVKIYWLNIFIGIIIKFKKNTR